MCELIRIMRIVIGRFVSLVVVVFSFVFCCRYILIMKLFSDSVV